MGLKEKILYKLMGTNEEIENIYKQKGYCDEWVEAYKNHHQKMKPLDKLSLINALITIGRCSEAETLINEMKITVLTDDDTKGVYYLTLLTLYLEQNRAEEAMSLLEKQKKFLDIFYSSLAYRNAAIAYYDAAAVCLAMNGYYNSAAQYYELEKKSAEKYDKSGIYPMITNVHLLKLAGSIGLAEQEAEKTKRYIEDYSGFSLPWQRAFMLELLQKSLV